MSTLIINIFLEGVKVFMHKNHYGSPRPTNGFDIILETYNSHKYPIIENQMNAVVFPQDMQRDVDAIDSMRFYGDIIKELKSN